MNNSLQKDDADLINIEQLYLQGTGQMIYDERSRLVLWDYVPNEYSRDDIVKAMKVNLELEEPDMIKEFTFSINDGDYEKQVTGKGPYNRTSTYTLLPDFTGDSESQARSYANSHGFTVSFVGSGGYVVSQNYPANKRIDLISGSVVLTLSGGNGTSSNTTPTNPTTPSDEDEDEEEEIEVIPPSGSNEENDEPPTPPNNEEKKEEEEIGDEIITEKPQNEPTE